MKKGITVLSLFDGISCGLIAYKGFCRFLTTRELELAQTLPVGYTSMLTRKQAENVLGDCWTVDVIAPIFSGLKFRED